MVFPHIHIQPAGSGEGTSEEQPPPPPVINYSSCYTHQNLVGQPHPAAQAAGKRPCPGRPCASPHPKVLSEEERTGVGKQPTVSAAERGKQGVFCLCVLLFWDQVKKLYTSKKIRQLKELPQF